MAYYFSYDIKGLRQELDILSDSQLLYPESKLHSTMLYVHDDYKENNIVFPNKKATIRGIEIWGTEKFYLVALLTDTNSELKNIHEQLKSITNTVDTRGLNPHISLQNSKNKEELISIDKLQFLIGLEVELYNFKCVTVNPKKLKPRI